MRKSRFAWVVVGLSLSVSACHNRSTPEGVVETAYHDLMKGDLKNFAKSLSGEALADFANRSSLTALQLELKDQNFMPGSVLLLGTQRLGEYGTQYTFSVPVLSRPKGDRAAGWTPLYEATVVCDTTAQWESSGCNWSPGWFDAASGSPWGPDWNYGFGWHGGYWACYPGYWVNSSACTITDLKKAG